MNFARNANPRDGNRKQCKALREAHLSGLDVTYRQVLILLCLVPLLDLAEEIQEKLMSERVRIDIENNVAIVTLNRADKRNAIDMAMFEALIEAGESLIDTPSVRAVVLHGAGRHFCAGIDISVFSGKGIGAVGSGLMDPRGRSPANLFQSAAWIWQEVPVPVIASLQGVVFGAGLQVALGADIRYAAPDVQMSIMEIKWG